ncbi:MAG TPA: tetratricopeptide repeat protein [Polyangiaceae bacterium]|nr:tetratricopeptide repeat protein [Polyangiaceae bacterium]
MAIEREKVLQAAQKYVDRKRYDRAIVEYQRLIADNPNDARTLLKIGDLQARMQAYPEAIATYDRVGQFYASQGFALKAIAVYKQIRELIERHVPQLADRYSHIVPRLAEIYAELGLTSDALAAYDEIAGRFQKAGRERDGIEIYRKMVVLDSSNPLPHLRLAEACCRVQSLDEAIESFGVAADLLIKANREDDALKVYERILHFRADMRFAKLAAHLYLRKGGQQDALHALAKLQVCFQQDPRDLGTLELLAAAFTAIGQESKAIEVQKEMARIARELGKADLYRKLVRHLQHVAPDDEQVRALSRLSELPQEAPRATQKSVDVAEEISEISVVEDADEHVEIDEGVEAVEEVDSRAGIDVVAHAQRALQDAEGFRRLRLHTKAVEVLQIALEINPGSRELRERVIELMAEAGDREGTIEAMLALSRLHVQSGQPELAWPVLEQILEAEPGHPEATAMLAEAGGDVPLPSFDLDESAGRGAGKPPAPQAAGSSAAARDAGASEAIELVLEEAEFFVARGMVEDAKSILLDQWARTPNHPLLREKLNELGVHSLPGTLPGLGMGRRSSRAPAGDDQAFDIAASLDALAQPAAQAGFADAEEQVDVDQVFAKFKEGVRQQVSEGDSSTHYDLGVAYKEMGLLKDAANEFEMAARDPAKECMCYSMIGGIQLELGDLELAADAFLRGLSSKQKTVEQEMNLYYDLGGIYEMTGNKEDALYYFKKITRRDPAYRDVQQKIAALEPRVSKPPAASRGGGDEDEFEKAFSDMFKK